MQRCDNCQGGLTSQCGGLLGAYQFGPQRNGNMADYFLVKDADFNLVAIPRALSDSRHSTQRICSRLGIAAAENAEIPVGGSVANSNPYFKKHGVEIIVTFSLLRRRSEGSQKQKAHRRKTKPR